MQYTLKNQQVSLTIDSQGAELANFVLLATGREYIWEARPEVWARHAPILFPIVGKLKNNEYEYKGRTWNLPQHGFARDMEFKLLDALEDTLEFELVNTEATYKVYPFKFSLKVKYQLVENQINVSWTVLNPDSTETLFFSIGAHPGFNILINEDEEISDYYLEFSEEETLFRQTLENGLLNLPENEPFINQTRTFWLSPGLFDRDALVFEGHTSKYMVLANRKQDYKVIVGIEGAPFLGIWAKPGASFLCIEPWHGIADAKHSHKDFTQKKGIIKLDPLNNFQFRYFIAIE